MRNLPLLLTLFFAHNLPAQKVQWAHKIAIEFAESSDRSVAIATSVDNATNTPNGQRADSRKPMTLNRVVAEVRQPVQIAGVLLCKSNFRDEIVKITVEDISGRTHRYIAGAFTVHMSPRHDGVIVELHNPPPAAITSIMADIYTDEDPRTRPVEALGMVENAPIEPRRLFDLHPRPVQKEYVLINRITQYAPVFAGASERLGNQINSVYKESKPLISPHGHRLYFVRKNAPGNFFGEKDEQDIYYSDFRNGAWSRPVNIGHPLNDRHPNGVCSISPAGDLMLVLDTYDHSSRRRSANSVSITRKTYSGWSEPVEQIISGFQNLCPFQDYCISNTGDVMIMAIQMDETIGDQDLYVSYRTGENRWSRPLNLGTVINTERAEFSPYLSPDNQVLYFASSGHGGFGNSDVFYTIRKSNNWTDWTEPVNLGSRINTPEWDAYFSMSPHMDYAYFISAGGAVNRTLYNPDDADIYRIALSAPGEERPVVVMRGRLINKLTNEPIGGDVVFTSLGQYPRKVSKIADDRDGYIVRLEAGKKYAVSADASGYLKMEFDADLRKVGNDEEMLRDIYLQPMMIGSTFTIDNLFFQQSEAMLLPESQAELEKLYQLLIEEPTLTIELGGHTDNQGSVNANLTLSQRRAETIRHYLIERGISSNRISAVGYGSSKPIASNRQIASRKLNRRVEVKVLNY